MNVALLEYVHFTIHVQENNPRLSLDSELDRRGPGIARHLIVVPFAADGFARFGLASHFIGFEVNDKPARVGSIEQVNDAAFIWEIVADFMVALGGVKFGEEQVGAQAFEQLEGFLDGGVDFFGVGQSCFKGEGLEKGFKIVVGKMPTTKGFVDEASD